MATRAISWIRKSSLVIKVSQAKASFSSQCVSTFKHGQQTSAPDFWASSRAMTPPAEKSRLFSVSELLKKNASCSPSFRPVIAQPTCCRSSLGFTQLSQTSSYSSTSGVYANVSIRFCKQRRNRGDMKGTSANHLCFGRYALQALEPAWISSRQILAGQLAIKRNVRGAKTLIRVFPHKPVSLRPAETRMGRGKGSTAYWVAGVRPGRILYEINGVSESVARRAISVAASKMPIRTQFVRS